MIKITKIVYVYDGYREIEKPEYTTYNSKEQMEQARLLMQKNKGCQNIFFTYQEL